METRVNTTPPVLSVVIFGVRYSQKWATEYLWKGRCGFWRKRNQTKGEYIRSSTGKAIVNGIWMQGNFIGFQARGIDALVFNLLLSGELSQ